MASQKFPFHVSLARRLPDPVFGKSLGITRHVWFVPVKAVPKKLPLDANARVPNINRRVYREIEESLLNKKGETNTFHLKHKGITVVADKVEQRGEDQFIVTFSDNQGILDGGHTYELITKDGGEEELPDGQFVKFEVLTSIPEDWIPEIAGGLNTSVQVQPMSLRNLEGKFDWIKDDLKNERYLNKVAWRENEPGEYDARDLIGLMTCFNIDLFPNSGDAQPIIAYKDKAHCLKLYEEREDAYRRLRPILRETLLLHDTIRCDSRKFWNEAGGKFGNLAFVETKSKGDYMFPFSGRTGKFRLMDGALYPMLAAFRWMVEDDPKTKAVRWKGGFRAVLNRWEASAEELIRATAQASNELGRNPNAIGKSRNHWANLHARVAMRDLMSKAGK